MKKTRLAIISLFFIFASSSLYAQSVNLSGTVEDDDSNPICGATLVVMATDSSVLAFAASDAQGVFKMKVKPTLDASLSVMCLGYQPQLLPINISKDTTLKIVLAPQVQDIGAVTITASRPTMEFKDGNMVVNIENLPNSSTLDLAKLLSKIPGVTASKMEGVTLYGGSATVYIDGRKQKIPPLQLLESLHGATVEQVELITVSGGQYDATDGAIINVITRKQRADGYHLSLGAGSGSYIDSDGELDAEGTIYFVVKKKNIIFNTFLRYRNDYIWDRQIDSTLYGDGTTIVRDNHSKGRTNSGGGYTNSSNLNWEVKKGHNLNFGFFWIREDFDFNASTKTARTTPLSPNAFHVLDDKSNESVNVLMGEVEYSTDNTKPNYYKALYNFYYRKNRGNTDYSYRLNMNDTSVPYLFDDSESAYYIHSLKFDYTHTFSPNTNISFGAKVDLSKVDVLMIYDDPLATGNYHNSIFTGDEGVYALYGQLYQRLSDNWSLQGGVRGEYHDLVAEQISGSIKVNNSNFSLFPFLNFSYNSNKYRSAWGLTSSIARPGFGSILSGEIYGDEFENSSGNPNLKPTRHYMFVWNQVFKSISLYTRYSYSTDLMDRILTTSPTNSEVRYYKYENYADMHQFYANITVPFSFFDSKLSGRFNGLAIFVSVKKPRNGYVIPEGRKNLWRGVTSLSVSYTPTDRLEISTYLLYMAAYKNAYTDYKYVWGMDASVEYTFLKDESLSVTLSFNDLFNSSDKDRYTTRYDNNTMWVNSRSMGRYINLSVHWRFNRGENVNNKARQKQPSFDRL